MNNSWGKSIGRLREIQSDFVQSTKTFQRFFGIQTNMAIGERFGMSELKDFQEETINKNIL
jgi:hypothetical protein